MQDTAETEATMWITGSDGDTYLDEDTEYLYRRMLLSTGGAQYARTSDFGEGAREFLPTIFGSKATLLPLQVVQAFKECDDLLAPHKRLAFELGRQKGRQEVFDSIKAVLAKG